MGRPVLAPRVPSWSTSAMRSRRLKCSKQQSARSIMSRRRATLLDSAAKICKVEKGSCWRRKKEEAVVMASGQVRHHFLMAFFGNPQRSSLWGHSMRCPRLFFDSLLLTGRALQTGFCPARKQDSDSASLVATLGGAGVIEGRGRALPSASAPFVRPPVPSAATRRSATWMSWAKQIGIAQSTALRVLLP